MVKRLDDGSEIRMPGDGDAEERRKQEALSKLNKNPRAVLAYVVGGVRMEVPLKDFMEKYGDPNQYSKNVLVKYVMDTWMKKNL